ncbi:PREDICTED: RING finger protein 10 isoform X2 [Lupinus angustifolius]|uniref:RING finger protein 10 isoform X2 n=1 Tax=Lupinus angustifolius TaxID=3871 RepID=UPI00092E2649|nr:PREDICTED: RING finger protein 10 isoform X2 [Lupinus angustifolius]
MSILPSQTQTAPSSSSSSSPSSNPNSQHGFSIPSSSSSIVDLPLGSLQIHDSQSNPGPSIPAAEDSSGTSEKVTEYGSPNDLEASSQQNSRTRSRSHSGRRMSRSSQSVGKTTGTTSSQRSQQTHGSVNSHGNSPLAGRKSQMVNGNYLLNFQYDPISRSQPRGPPPPPPRRQRKRKPYNKDLFLQANYKFMVLDSGNYSAESMDPDKMLQWEDIICVTYSTPLPIQCPICLEYPLCPQITSCGHIFCFPCILQYLLLGEEDNKGECWKRCPLCFVMVSVKDLYTVHITNVKQYQVGDNIEFTFLTRKKDSFTLSHKNKQETDMTSCGNEDLCDPFSKFTLTSDVDLSVRHAISDLDGWLARADSGLVDDLEKLPYVCAAMQQLKQRKKYWNEHRACDNEKSSRLIDYGHQIPSAAVSFMDTDDETRSNGSRTSSTDFHDRSKGIILDKAIAGTSLDQTSDVEKVLADQEMNLSSYEEKNSIRRHSYGSGDVKEGDSYNFYQACDGQHVILHTLNMKALLHHYGSYDKLPHRISGRILQLEAVTQSEAMRRRYRFISHFPLTTTFQLCEIDLSDILPPEALAPFMDEIKKRLNQRKQLAKKELKEKIKAEAASTYSVTIPTSYQLASRDNPPVFSMDDFGALGNSAMSSSPPVVGERKLFSNVTRLGFAAAHDSPSLQIQETGGSHDNNTTIASSSATGLRNAEAPSYSNVISRPDSNISLNAPKTNDAGKRGKKPNRVLLSTSGGRRY